MLKVIVLLLLISNLLTLHYFLDSSSLSKRINNNIVSQDLAKPTPSDTTTTPYPTPTPIVIYKTVTQDCPLTPTATTCQDYSADLKNKDDKITILTNTANALSANLQNCNRNLNFVQYQFRSLRGY